MIRVLMQNVKKITLLAVLIAGSFSLYATQSHAKSSCSTDISYPCKDVKSISTSLTHSFHNFYVLCRDNSTYKARHEVVEVRNEHFRNTFVVCMTGEWDIIIHG